MKQNNNLKQIVMKNIVMIFAMLLAAQAHAQQSFSNAALVNVHSHNAITFSLPCETNVVHYRIEASNDGNEYEILGTLRSAGNSMLATTYHYDLYPSDYKYYRIGMVKMNGSLLYSQVIDALTHKLPLEPTAPTVTPIISNSVANCK
jgi:hypothetical protein